MKFQRMDSQDESDAEHQYVSGQFRDSFATLFTNFDKLNVQALATHSWQLDLRYGQHERQTFDLCSAVGSRAKATVLYLHAGYWQSRDKAQFRFLVPALANAGFNVAMINYPLSPEMRVDQITEAVREVIPALEAKLGANQKGLPLILIGHSAGAHLAIELAMGLPLVPQAQMAAVICISGVFDLTPLVSTSLNEKLALDDACAFSNSPLYRVNSNALPVAFFLVGGEETSAFQEQSRAMAERWETAGNQSRFITMEGQDHFSVLDTLQGANGLLLALARELFPGA